VIRRILLHIGEDRAMAERAATLAVPSLVLGVSIVAGY